MAMATNYMFPCAAGIFLFSRYLQSPKLRPPDAATSREFELPTIASFRAIVFRFSETRARRYLVGIIMPAEYRFNEYSM